MPRNEAIKAVLASEAAGGLWQRDVLGFPVWSLERFRRYRMEALRGRPEVAAATTQLQGRARLQAEWNAFTASVADLRRGGVAARTAAGRDLWVLSSSGYRRRGPDGTWRCIFAEHLRQQLADRLLFVEFNTARLPSLGRDDTCFIDAAQQPLLTAARLASPGLGLWLDRGTGQAGPFAPTSPRRLADRALYGRGLLELGRRWMDAAPPAAVFVICGYNMHVPLQMAARERGIPVLELQHGLVYESHAGYVLPPEVDAPGRTLPVPDHMVIFGEYFGRLLQRESPRWEGRWTVAGHPWLKEKRGGEDSPARAGRRVILFSQYELDVRRQVLDAALALRRGLDPEDTVVIKPHPRESDAADFFREAVQAGAELAGPTADSYALMKDCDLAVSVYSTIAVEALAFPCRSAVLPSDRWTDTISEFVASGLLELAEDAQALVALARRDPGASDRRAVARDLFGIGAAEPDFAALVDRLRGA